MALYKLDHKDRKILFELDRDSRQSINDLAKKTRLSRDVVTYRMKRLENAGVIQNYITIIDYSKFVHHIIRLYLKLQNTTTAIEEEIAQFFVQQDTTLTVYKTDGHFDLAVGFLIKDLHSYYTMYQQFLHQFRKYITEAQFSIFLDYIHFHRNYLADVKHQDYAAISTGSFVPYDADEADLQLLNLIKENSRITLLELAQHLKMTAAGVKYKLRNLEKQKVIVAYKLLLDATKLGYRYYKIDLLLEDTSIIPALNEYITRHPNILYRDIVIGGSDFEFDGEFKSEEEFYRFMDELKRVFPKKIRHYFYYRALKMYKYSYLPRIKE